MVNLVGGGVTVIKGDYLLLFKTFPYCYTFIHTLYIVNISGSENVFRLFLFQIFQVEDREEEVLADCRLEVCGST